jgi:WD40 repeat protein
MEADCTLFIIRVSACGIPTGQQLATLQSHTCPVLSLALCRSLLVSGSLDKSVKLWDTGIAQLLRTLQGHEHGVASVRVTSDGSRAVSGSFDMSVRVWDVDSGTQLAHLASNSLRATLRGHTNKVRAPLFL